MSLARMPHEEEQPEEESTEEAGESAVPDADEAPAGAPKAEEPSQPETCPEAARRRSDNNICKSEKNSPGEWGYSRRYFAIRRDWKPGHPIRMSRLFSYMSRKKPPYLEKHMIIFEKYSLLLK